MVPEESKQPWQRSRLASDTSERRAADGRRLRRLEQLAESTARAVLAGSREMPAWLAASAGRTRPVPRRWDGSLDIHEMIRQGQASVAAIERRRAETWDRNAAARTRAMNVYETVRARHGYPPAELRSDDWMTAAMNGNLMGTVPPNPAQTRMTVF